MPGHQQADGNHDRSGGIEREHRLGGRDTDKRTYPVNTDYVNDNLGAKSSTDPTTTSPPPQAPVPVTPAPTYYVYDVYHVC